MKIILSRKGFDSSAGGCPSLVLPNGWMVSLPIPDNLGEFAYSDLCWPDSDNKETYMDYMKKISDKKISLEGEAKCHLDPDLNRNVLKDREREWRGCFGQKESAQGTLAKNNVGEGDLFLFFGWFNTFSEKNGVISFNDRSGFHAIYGYLQIDEYYCKSVDSDEYCTPAGKLIPEWVKYHPHMSDEFRKKTNNCIYVARERASWNEKIPGYGCFVYDEELRLTKEGERRRTRWNLPTTFKELKINGRDKSNSWKEGYFQSAPRGQEFVFEENEEVTRWAQDLINKATLYTPYTPVY